MAEARAQGWNLVLAVVCVLGLAGPAMGQAPVFVDQRPIPPSPAGEMGDAEIARAVATIRDLGTTFAALSGRERAAAARARWATYQRTYQDAANRLDTLFAAGQITIRDLPEAQSVATADGGIVLDTTLAGRWDAGAVRARRRQGTGDWADISRLAGVLAEQLALDNSAGRWDAWSAAHAQATDLRNLVGEAPSQSLQPLLIRFWLMQDKYLANALTPTGGDTPESITGAVRLVRAAALGNEMLAVLKQVESAGGWPWRKALETVWGERDDQARALARAMAAAAVIGRDAARPAPPLLVVDRAAPASPSAPAPPASALPSLPVVPRSTDFDELFADPDPAPPVTAAGPADGATQSQALRAEMDALARENSARAQESQDLTAQLSDLSGQVSALAANVAEQGRQLETLTGGIAVTRTIPAALTALTESQRALERRLADLSREVGPDGLSRQMNALTAALEAERSRSEGAAQRLEAGVQDRLRALSRKIEAARQQASEVQSGLSAFRPSPTVVEVPLQDPGARRAALRQAVIAGVGLLALLLAAIAFWVHGTRQRSVRAPDTDPTGADTTEDAGAGASVQTGSEGLSLLLSKLHSLDRNALRDELTQLRNDIETERGRAGDLDARLTQVTAQLGESQARAQRLAAALAALRADTQTVGRGLLDGAARDAAMGGELAALRQAIEAERERAGGLQTLIDELRASAAVPDAAPESRVEDIPEAPVYRSAPPPALADLAARHRAIEALHRGDLPGFEQAFAQLTALPLPAVERIVRQANGRDLALACRAVDIAKPHLAAILILSRRRQPGERQQVPRQLAEAMRAFDDSSADVAERSLQGLRSRAYETDRQRAGEFT